MIYLSAGHHNADSVAVGNGYKEADLTKELCNAIVKELDKMGVKDKDCLIKTDDYPLGSNKSAQTSNTGDGTFNVLMNKIGGFQAHESQLTFYILTKNNVQSLRL